MKFLKIQGSHHFEKPLNCHNSAVVRRITRNLVWRHILSLLNLVLDKSLIFKKSKTANGRCLDISVVDTQTDSARDITGVVLMGVHIGITWRIRLNCLCDGDVALCQITLTTCYTSNYCVLSFKSHMHMKYTSYHLCYSCLQLSDLFNFRYSAYSILDCIVSTWIESRKWTKQTVLIHRMNGDCGMERQVQTSVTLATETSTEATAEFMVCNYMHLH